MATVEDFIEEFGMQKGKLQDSHVAIDIWSKANQILTL